MSKVSKNVEKRSIVDVLVAILAIVILVFQIIKLFGPNPASIGWLIVAAVVLLAEILFDWRLLARLLGKPIKLLQEWISSKFSDEENVENEAEVELPEVNTPEVVIEAKPSNDKLTDKGKNDWTYVGWVERPKLDEKNAPAGKRLDTYTNTWVDAPKPAAPAVSDKEKVERLMAMGYTLDEAMYKVEKANSK